jgi:hypothetical protein
MAMTLLTTNGPFSNASTSNFTSSIDSTYKLYIFKFISIHLDSTGNLQFQGSIDSGSNYNVAITSATFKARHTEADSGFVQYQTGQDQAQGTSYQQLNDQQHQDADVGSAGTLWLFNPSNSTYVKHFYARYAAHDDNPGIIDFYTSGYFNTTSAIDAISFKPNSSTFDGTIKMYGVG